MLINLLLIIFAYLLGSVSASIIVCNLLGLDDPRTVGSKNPGATNVLRVYGKKAGIISLAGDLIKGIIPVLVARYAGGPDWVIAASGFFVFFGASVSCFFSVQGRQRRRHPGRGIDRDILGPGLIVCCDLVNHRQSVSLFLPGWHERSHDITCLRILADTGSILCGMPCHDGLDGTGSTS